MLVELSGVSTDLLRETDKFQQKEKIKYSRYGQLVLIPAILGFIAGTYAFSVISNNIYACIAFGAIWFFVILSVDMAMSATIYKSKHGSGFGFFTAIFFRLAFSILVGIVISHPLVLRVFEPSIEKFIEANDKKEKNEAIREATVKVTDAEKPFQEKIDRLRDLNLCLNRLIQFESSVENIYAKEFVIPNTNIPCGSSSGRKQGCGGECRDRKATVKANIKEIADIEKEKKNSIAKISQEEILKKTKNDAANPVTKDYLARTDALGILANGDSSANIKGHEHIKIASNLLIWFFVFLDCLIVIFKASTPMGAYEHTNDIFLERHIAFLEAEKDAHIAYIKTISTGKAKVKAEYEVEIAKVLKEHRLISGSIYEIDKDAENLKSIKDKMLKDVGLFNLSRRKEIKKQIFNMEALLDLSRAKAIDGLSDRLGKL